MCTRRAGSIVLRESGSIMVVSPSVFIGSGPCPDQWWPCLAELDMFSNMLPLLRSGLRIDKEMKRPAHIQPAWCYSARNL